MELKTNYQYTYFVHPFVIKETKYKRYILKLLRDENCKLKIFQREKDLYLYKYFSPKVREALFSSFSFTNEKLKSFNEMPIETRAAILSKYNCTIFEYELKKDIQGKIEKEENSIFFRIQRMEIICFNTGICFLCMKTNIENGDDFSEILNFNYKFRDITQENNNLNNYDRIKIQMDNYSSIEKFTDLVRQITGSNIESLKLDIDTERFLTYSYACIDQNAWNSQYNFDNIKHNFIKFAKILPADNYANLIEDDIVSFSKWKFAKMGITKQGIVLMASSADMNNYTILPQDYENQYFYTYILSLYKKLYLKKLNLEFKNSINVRKTRRKFIEFTKNLWIQEVTTDEVGTMLEHKLKEVFEIDTLYYKIKNEYDLLYKEFKIENNRKFTILIIILLIYLLACNIIRIFLLIILFKIKKAKKNYMFNSFRVNFDELGRNKKWKLNVAQI